MAGAAPARLTLLGGWQLELAGAPLAVPPGGRRLIALPALRGPMPRARAAAVLFPRLGLVAAGARLRDLISRCLRRCPELDAVLQVGPDLALAESVWVDCWDLATTTAALLTGDATALHALGERPTACDLLPGWDEEWVATERERLRRKLSRALCRYAAERFHAGDLPGALIAAERAAAMDPLDEVAGRWKIRAHLGAGDAALALRTFEDLRRALRRDLAVDPEPATMELIRGGLERGMLPQRRVVRQPLTVT